MNPGAMTLPAQSITMPVVRSGRGEMRWILPARDQEVAGKWRPARAVHDEAALENDVLLFARGAVCHCDYH